MQQGSRGRGTDRGRVEGLIVKNPWDVTELEAALNRLISDRDLRRRMGEAGRRRTERTAGTRRHGKRWPSTRNSTANAPVFQGARRDVTNLAFLVNGDYARRDGPSRLASPISCAGLTASIFSIALTEKSGPPCVSWPRFSSGRPSVCYVFDMAYSGVAGALMYKRLTRGRIVIDTGDAITELARSLDRSPLGVGLTRRLEECSLSQADRIVVRGTFHQEWLARRGVRSEVVQDGIESSFIGTPQPDDLRKQLGLEGTLTVGLVGSLAWSARLQSCYGWDLIELIRILKDHPIKGVVIGDGSGLPILQARCREYGIADRVLFLGRMPYEELPQRFGPHRRCLSTQTNDLPGQVRTTGKLPLYLATGRYILASRVGEAARLLGGNAR